VLVKNNVAVDLKHSAAEVWLVGPDAADLLRNTRPLAWEARRGSSYGNGGHNRIAECLRLCP
jgi:hypothetical protein